jgi:hypothetical protein
MSRYNGSDAISFKSCSINDNQEEDNIPAYNSQPLMELNSSNENSIRASEFI